MLNFNSTINCSTNIPPTFLLNERFDHIYSPSSGLKFSKNTFKSNFNKKNIQN